MRSVAGFAVVHRAAPAARAAAQFLNAMATGATGVSHKVVGGADQGGLAVTGTVVGVAVGAAVVGASGGGA